MPHLEIQLAAEQSAEYAREVMDHHMVSRTGQVSAEREASNPCSGHGALNERGECDCRDGYTGPTCSLKGLGDHHEYGRFVGDKRCENGVAVGDHCECDAGWEGFHCHRRACLHGSFRCPDGSKFCIKAACVCDEGFQVRRRVGCVHAHARARACTHARNCLAGPAC